MGIITILILLVIAFIAGFATGMNFLDKGGKDGYGG
jgi:hypothetical protein